MECGIFARLEIHLTIHFSRKNQLKRIGTCSYNNALHLFNKAKCRLFRSIMNFKKFENHLDFVCQPASQPACRTAVRPGSARCTAPEIQHSKGYPFPFTKLLFRRPVIHCAIVIPLYFLSSLSIGMRKQFQHDHNIPYKM